MRRIGEVTTLDLESPEERVCRICRQPFVARYQPERVCQECVESHRLRTAERYREERVSRWLGMLQACGLSGRLTGYRLETFDESLQPEAFAAVQEALDQWS